jgi:hypothetical protein
MRAKFGDQWPAAGEAIKREIAIVVIVTIEKSRLLITMEGNVCSVKIQDNLFGCFMEMFNKKINQEILDLLRVPGDAIVSISIFRILLKPEFQAIESAFPSQTMAWVLPEDGI